MTPEAVERLYPGAMPIPGYDGLFASTAGDIVSIRRGRPRPMSPYPVRTHLRVSIRTNGESEPARVHQLVCSAFHGERPSPEHRAIHRNGDGHDNRPENLMWATPAQQIAGQIERGTQARGSRHGQSKLVEREVGEIKSLAARGYTNEELGGRFHCCPSNIGHIVKGKTWRHVGAEDGEGQVPAMGQVGAGGS